MGARSHVLDRSHDFLDLVKNATSGARYDVLRLYHPPLSLRTRIRTTSSTVSLSCSLPSARRCPRIKFVSIDDCPTNTTTRFSKVILDVFTGGEVEEYTLELSLYRCCGRWARHVAALQGRNISRSVAVSQPASREVWVSAADTDFPWFWTSPGVHNMCARAVEAQSLTRWW